MSKGTERLDELIRLASANLLTKEDKYGLFYQPELKKRLVGKYPECFISLKKMGRDTSPYMLPICNRAGIIDLDVIEVAYKAINKLMSDPGGMYDINDLKSILDRLDRMKARYNKEVPKPPKAAARKAVVTRMFNNIKNHLMIARKQ